MNKTKTSINNAVKINGECFIKEHILKADFQLKTVLAREMRSRNLNVPSLSEQCGIAATTLRGWVDGVSPNLKKNASELMQLGEFFGLTLSTLLFNVSESNPGDTILFSSQFVDNGHKYQLTITKMKSDK